MALAEVMRDLSGGGPRRCVSPPRRQSSLSRCERRRRWPRMVSIRTRRMFEDVRNLRRFEGETEQDARSARTGWYFHAHFRYACTVLISVRSEVQLLDGPSRELRAPHQRLTVRGSLYPLSNHGPARDVRNPTAAGRSAITSMRPNTPPSREAGGQYRALQWQARRKRLECRVEPRR